jgi:HD-GYP domain-containing protein (c-di-GMP phosphodiesterase class II)
MNLDREHFAYASGAEFPQSEFIHNHVLNVAVLSLILGIFYDFEPKELVSLGMGAILHDLGKVLFPEMASKTFPELKAEERSQWYRHPDLGGRMLAGETAVTEIERQIVIQHHERQDGTGFPSGLVGDHSKPTKKPHPMSGRIFRLAEIVSVADAFDACVSGNPPGGPRSPEQALDVLSKETESRLNSHVVRSLLNLVTLFPTGRLVRLLRHRDRSLVGHLGVVSHSDTASSREIEVRLFRNPDERPISPRSVRVNVDSNLYFRFVEMVN